MAAGLPGPGVPAINVGGKEKDLQQQAGIELNLKENNGKQGDVDQPKRIVADLFQTRQPDTQQPGKRADRLDP